MKSGLMNESKVLRFSTEAMEGIAREVMAAFNAVPRRGAETGGLLLGHDGDAEGEVKVRDFEPVVCSHRFGPSFLLDEADQKELEESLAFFNGPQPDALPIAGLFRSNTRPHLGLDTSDEELLARYFADRAAVFVILQPSRDQSIRADFWKWTGVALEPLADGVAFPLAQDDGVPLAAGQAPAKMVVPEVEATVAEPVKVEPVDEPAPPVEEISLVVPEPVAEPQPEIPVQEAAPAPPPLRPQRVLPPPRPVWVPPPEPRQSRKWGLWAVGLIIVMGAGYLGYRSALESPTPGASETSTVQIPRPAEPPAATTTPPASTPPAEPAPPPPTAPAAVEPAPAPRTQESRADRAAPDPKMAVRRLLEEWAAANRSGEPREVANFYEPKVTRYLGRRNVTRRDVSNRVAAFIAVHGTPSIFRISDLRIEPSGDDQATATFRKHWQTTGRRVFAGEEEHRLSLVLRGGQWKIAAEDELRVFWTHSVK
jgi:ketosteroid isomerase-like protein